MTDLEKAFIDKRELSSRDIEKISTAKELSILVDQGKVKIETLSKNSIWKWKQ